MISAPAKFILLGEHSVVHQGRAMAFALPSLRLGIQKTNGPTTLNGQVITGGSSQLLQELFRTLEITDDFEITSNIPIGAGLGSSAALSLALAKYQSSSTLSVNDLAARALEGERVFHARPSGVDVYAIAANRAILFNPRPKPFFEELDLTYFKTHNLSIAVFDSNEEHSTKAVQESVHELKLKTPIIFEQIIDQLSNNVEEALRLFQAAAKGSSSRPQDLGLLMRDSHLRLRHLGVSTEKIEALVSLLESHDSCLGAKLTGAGGGGSVIGLFKAEASFEQLPVKPIAVWTAR